MASLRDSDFEMLSAASDSTKEKESKLELNNTKAKMSIAFRSQLELLVLLANILKLGLL